MPVLRLEARLRAVSPGDAILILADDPIAPADIPFFAKQGGHVCRRLPDEAGACVFLVTRGEKPAG